MRRSLKALAVVLCIVSGFSFSLRPSGGNYSLVVVQYNASDPKAVIQDIVKYKFENGEYKGKEKIITVTGRENNKDLNRFDSEGGFIFKNRWLISGIGNILDMKEKKIITSERANFVGQNDDSLVFYTNDIFKGKYYSVFDAKKNTYTQVKSVLFKALKGQDIGVDYETSNRRIWLYPTDKPKVLLVADAGFGEEVINSKSTTPIPYVWIDNNNFIFPHYNISKNEATIFKVNVNKTQTKLGVIKEIPKSHEASYFTKDGDGNIEYVCGKGTFKIDTKSNKVSEVMYEHVGYDFDVECQTQSYGHMIKYNKQEIGKYNMSPKNVRTCPIAIAFDNNMKLGDEVYPQGIAVWNTVTRNWKKIDADEVASILGWIEEN